ncbi:fucolectin-like isoform X1 [Bufo gargarizans]|uniref:fucolectin-like isoform X1 n=1 Tax=Bufo gargarizans TaxID=30331 RepID=UPI001CF5B8F2|nr:fucolectin-like isoform X1 [Bufo gargarizans]
MFKMKLLLFIVLIWFVSDDSCAGGVIEESPSNMERPEQEAVHLRSKRSPNGNTEDKHQYMNVALQGRATQSSVLLTKEGYIPIAINAIDGNQDPNFNHGSCIHTQHELSPWWRVDLIKSYRISHITITNRGDCCGERLNGAEILVGDSLANNGNNNPRCAVVTTIPTGGSQTFLCNDMVGRYVNVNLTGKETYLQLCEVQVFGAEVLKENSCYNNS